MLESMNMNNTGWSLMRMKTSEILERLRLKFVLLMTSAQTHIMLPSHFHTPKEFLWLTCLYYIQCQRKPN